MEQKHLYMLKVTVCSISTSVTGRLPRVNTREVMTYKSYSIPTGTPVSTTQRLTHFNSSIFPSPDSFLPERWLISAAERKILEKYLQPFGRGSRSCLGIQSVFLSPQLSLEFNSNPFLNSYFRYSSWKQGGWSKYSE
jgi:cytochrome P450